MTDFAVPFEVAWRRACDIEGWLTHEQARVLHEEAARAAPGRVVEIGSHLGRSTIVLASSGAEVTAIDPFPVDWRYGRTDTEQRLRQHLASAGVDSRVDIRASTSAQVQESWTDEVRLLYIDGKHDVWSCRKDLRWSDHLRSGDVILVHDAFSSLGVTLAVLVDTLTTRRHRYLGRTASLARFEMARPSLLDRARVMGELPWFARNLVVKVLLRCRLRPIARILGHTDTYDPY